MADVTPTPENDPTPQPAKQPAPKKKARWGRRILVGVVVVAVLLIGLVLLLPTLLSSGAGKSFAVGRVNAGIPGKIEIADWSVGWFSGTHVTGLKLYDAKDALIFELNKLDTDLTLLQAVRGQYALGNTSADANLVRLVIDNGRTNYQDALGLKPSTDQSKSSSKLPDVSGDIKLKLRGDVDSPGAPTVRIEPSTVNLALSGINDPIKNAADLGFSVDDAPAGRLKASGTIDAVQNNEISLDALAAKQDVSAEKVALAALTPLLKLAGLDLDAAGTLDGKATLSADGKAGALDGSFAIADAQFGGKMLKGDTLKFATVDIPLDVKLDRSDAAATKIKINQLAVKVPQGSLAVTGDVVQQALKRVADGQAPGAPGTLNITADFPQFAEIANQLPNTLGTGADVKLTSAALKDVLAATFTDADVKVNNQLNAQAAGTQGGNQVSLQPVAATAAATVKPGDKLLDRLADLSAKITSDFATLDLAGPTVPQVKGTGKVLLAKARQTAQQFGYLQGAELAGTADLKVAPGAAAKGQTAPTAVATITTTDLHYKPAPTPATLPATQPVAPAALDLPWSVVTASVWSDPAAPAKVTRADVTAQAGEKPGDSKLDLVANADGIDTATTSVKSLDLKKLNVSDLPWLVNRAGGYVALPAGVDVTKGELYSHAKLSYDGPSKIVTFIEPLELSTPHLTVAQNGATVLRDEKIHAFLGGTIATPDGGTTADLSTLSVESSFLTLAKAEGPLKVSLPANGTPTGSGTVTVKADVPKVLALAGSGGTPAKPAAAQITAGTFDGSLALDGKADALVARLLGKLTGLNVTTPTEPITHETVAIDFTATATDGLNTLAADGTVKSAFANAVVKSLKLKRGESVPTDDLLAGLQSADVSVDAPNLSKLVSLYNAFFPPAPVAPAAPPAATDANTPAAEPAPPIDVKSGALKANLLVKRDGQNATLNVDATATGLAAGRGGEYTQPFDVNLKTDAAYDPAGALDLRTMALAVGDAMSVSANGKIADPTGQRRLDGVKGTLGYDLEKLKGLLLPLAAPASRQTLADTTMLGTFKDLPFTASGSYPAGLDFNQAVKTLAATATLTADRIDTSGLDARDLTLPLVVKDGRLTFAPLPESAKKATLNGGELNLVDPNLSVDLTADTPRLTLAGGRQRLVVGAKLNPVLSQQIGKFAGPQFANATKATGLIDLTVLNADGVALGAPLYTPQSGSAKLALSVRDLEIENTLWSNAFGGVVSALPNLGSQVSRFTSLQGRITDAVITLAAGQVTEDLTFTVIDPATGGGDRAKADTYPLTFAGGVGLSDLKLNNFKMEFPRKLLSNWFGGDVDKVIDYLPQTVPVSLVGSASNPQTKFDAGKLLQKGVENAVGKQLKDRTGVDLGGILGGDKKQGGEKNDGEKKDGGNPLGGLIDQLKKK